MRWCSGERQHQDRARRSRTKSDAAGPRTVASQGGVPLGSSSLGLGLGLGLHLRVPVSGASGSMRRGRRRQGKGIGALL